MGNGGNKKKNYGKGEKMRKQMDVLPQIRKICTFQIKVGSSERARENPRKIRMAYPRRYGNSVKIRYKNGSRVNKRPRLRLIGRLANFKIWKTLLRKKRSFSKIYFKKVTWTSFCKFEGFLQCQQFFEFYK